MSEKIPKGWKKVRLGEIAEIIMGQSPPSFTYNEDGKGLPFYQGIVDFGYRFAFPRVFCTKPKKIVDENFVLLSVRAPVGEVNLTKEKCAIGRGNAGLKAKNGQKLFLYYLLKYNMKKLKSSSEGTVFSSINKSTIENLEIEIPESIDEQRAIASILSSLDDKIDLLHRQNKTLESMAETLFRKWFIEEAKEDWEEGVLGDVIKISSGKGIKKDKFIEKGLYPVLGSNGEIGRTNDYLFDEKLIYTGRVGTLGNVFISEGKVWLSDNTLIIRPISYSWFFFIYFFLKSIKLQELNVGSTQPLIRQTDLKELELPIPDNVTLNNFHKISENLFNKIRQNQQQIRTLEQLRDTLLPKLISGEVRVKY